MQHPEAQRLNMADDELVSYRQNRDWVRAVHDLLHRHGCRNYAVLHTYFNVLVCYDFCVLVGQQEYSELGRRALEDLKHTLRRLHVDGIGLPQI